MQETRRPHRKTSPLQLLSLGAMALVLIALVSLDVFLFRTQPETITTTSSPQNPIIQENQKPGTNSWQMTKDTTYDVKTFRSPVIESYAWKSSVVAGETLSFSVSTTQLLFTARIYRLGWYQGLGGRLLQTLSNQTGHFYAMPAMDPQTGLVDPSWPEAFHIKIAPDWVTGIYIAKLTASDGTEAYAPFVVRSTQTGSFVFLHGDTTDQAYNPWGGKSLYDFNSSNQHRAYKVSFNRPLTDQAGFGNLLYWEYPMIRWLEKSGYNLDYLSTVDVHNNPNSLKNHHGILIVGHSEYWSKEIRDHLEAAVNSGINIASFAADSGSWQVRFEASSSTYNPQPDRILVCYKDKTLDPLLGKDNAHVTTAFRQPPLNRPEQSFFGSMSGAYFSNPSSYPWIVTNASNWVFAGTGIKNGDSLPGLVGYECDRVDAAYPTPGAVSVLSTSPVYTDDHFHRVCNSTIYVARSGARVFNAATFKWSWGLDAFNIADGHKSVVNIAIQLITQNILLNFQIGPEAIQSSRSAG